MPSGFCALSTTTRTPNGAQTLSFVSLAFSVKQQCGTTNLRFYRELEHIKFYSSLRGAFFREQKFIRRYSCSFQIYPSLDCDQFLFCSKICEKNATTESSMKRESFARAANPRVARVPEGKRTRLLAASPLVLATCTRPSQSIPSFELRNLSCLIKLTISWEGKFFFLALLPGIPSKFKAISTTFPCLQKLNFCHLF